MKYNFSEVINLERMGVDVSPQQRIEDMIRVTELCIDLLKENEEHHGEVCFFFKFVNCPLFFWIFLKSINFLILSFF